MRGDMTGSKASDAVPFKTKLRYHRTSRGWSQAKLARKAHVSPSYVSYLEKGVKSATEDVVVALSRALTLSPAETTEFLAASGYGPLNDPELQVVLRPIHDLLARPSISADEREALAGSLQEFVTHWEERVSARSLPLRKAVLVAAGWQPRLLSPSSLERTLIHAAHEVVKAGIKQLIVVVAPEMPEWTFEHLNDALNTKGGHRQVQLMITPVVQEQPRGLGNAILVTRKYLGDEVFAVILPDDIDPSRTTLRRMIEEYVKVRKPMIAVNPELHASASKISELRYYGIASLGQQIETAARLHYVNGVMEKPQKVEELPPSPRLIVGRYILTQEILDLLQASEPNKRTGKYELTDALARSLHGRALCAYSLDQSLLPIAPVRYLIERLIDSVKDRKRLQRKLEVAKRALSEIDRV